jgi:RNA polymerase sigma-70 factor, ECF subfamily
MRSDDETLAALRGGDEQVFVELVQQHHALMLRVASRYVRSRAVAEEVVQETWLGVLEGLDRFEGRARFTTWMFRILVNRAKTRGERERRTVPFATLAAGEASGEPAAVAPDRFLGADHDRWPHHWAMPPRRWEESPEHNLATAETLSLVKEAIDTLPPMQRLVISMRDLDGWDGPDVCNALGVSETNQRVLLHRARSRVRGALEAYFAE